MLYILSIFGLAVLFPVSFFGKSQGWYERKDNLFSRIMHFFGGLFVAIFMSGYFASSLLEADSARFLFAIIGTTILVGVLWEMAEYIFGRYMLKKFGIRKYLTQIKDTIEDLFFDILGAVVWVIIFIATI
jgi:uncharacterized membrane protein YjdF